MEPNQFLMPGQWQFQGRGPEDLSVRELATLARDHWNENPICRRVWRKIRPYVILYLVLLVLMMAPALAMMFLAGDPGAMIQYIIILTIGSCIGGLVGVAIWLLFPIMYGRWIYRKTWSADVALQSVPLTKTDRVMGALCPVVVAVALSSILSMALQVLAVCLSYFLIERTGTALEEAFAIKIYGPLSLIASLLAAVSNSASGFCIMLLTTLTVALRMMLLQEKHNPLVVTSNWSIAAPFISAMILGGGWAIGRTCMEEYWPTEHDHLDINQMFAHLTLVIIDVAFLFLFYFVFHKMWAADFPVARRVLFEPHDTSAA